MATINFEVHGHKGGALGAAPAVVSGVNTASVTGYVANARQIYISPAVTSVIGVTPGWYDHVSTDANGNWTYAPSDRGGG